MRAPSAIAMFDDEMRFIAVSLRFLADYRLLSESQHSVVGRSLYDVLLDIPERCRDMHRRVLGGEMLSGIEDWSPRADGTRDGMTWGMGPWRLPTVRSEAP
jgi:hypothetical protein